MNTLLKALDLRDNKNYMISVDMTMYDIEEDIEASGDMCIISNKINPDITHLVYGSIFLLHQYANGFGQTRMN